VVVPTRVLPLAALFEELSLKGHIHILGICGTFMGGIALLARELGYRVTGSDASVYPPMSTQLRAAGIDLMEGYLPEHLYERPDMVVVGNAMTRGNPAVEYMLNRGLAYTSGPQWLAEHLLHDKWVLAVAGTHGKTTTSSLLAWILEYAGLTPGFLIGGVPGNFGLSARPGSSEFFVVEADEYDTAFFDKRSKFVHYRPRTLAINNLEFDHADIFDDLGAIQRQFHHLVRCVPGEGLIVHPGGVDAIDQTLALGCWTPVTTFGVGLASDADWRAELLRDDGTEFRLHHGGMQPLTINWSQCGLHNVENAVTAVAAARHVGVPPAVAAEALAGFGGVKRRLELLATIGDIAVYDDFAHHPTAIATTLQGLRRQVGVVLRQVEQAALRPALRRAHGDPGATPLAQDGAQAAVVVERRYHLRRDRRALPVVLEQELLEHVGGLPAGGVLEVERLPVHDRPIADQEDLDVRPGVGL